jgi:hypothetical protein
VTSSLEAIVKHDRRLDLLACLVDGEPLTVPKLSAETGLRFAITSSCSPPSISSRGPAS